MLPSVADFQLWLDSPVTKWVKEMFADDIYKLEQKLQTTRFDKLESVTEAQVTLDCAKRWSEEPERRLKLMLKNANKPEDETFS